MYNGAWDYPADTRGYTWGFVQELHTRSWAFRYGIVGEPKIANGSQFDRRLFRDHGQVWEAERRYSWRKHDGAIRALAYDNRSQAGTYGDALKLAAQTGTKPDVTLTSRVGTLKYGFGMSFDQAINSGSGSSRVWGGMTAKRRVGLLRLLTGSRPGASRLKELAGTEDLMLLERLLRPPVCQGFISSIWPPEVLIS